MTRHPRSCVVIGAGLAGLAAAYRLTRNGWTVTVLEAQPRLGGRVKSHRFAEAPGVNCELGGEWIGRSHTRMRRLCREFHLPLQPHTYAFCFWNGTARSRMYAPGAWCFSNRRARKRFDALARKFNRLDPKRDELTFRQMDQTDWWTTLQRLGFTRDELLQSDLMDSTDFGESIRLTSSYLAATEYLTDDPTDQMDFKIRGGNSRLVEALVKRIERRGAVHRNVRVTRIEQGPDGIALHARGRSAPYRAEHCICTVPAHGLTRMEWTPSLPGDQWNAASQLQYSRIMKTAILCGERFWPTPTRGGFSIFTSRAADYCFDSTYGQPGKHGILCSYAIGDKADDLDSDSSEPALMKWITGDVAAAVGCRPDTRVRPIAIERQAWQAEEWIGGAYAFYRPGQWFTLRPILNRPHGRVRFAGEHLSEPWQGFMEGAVETGEAAADSLMKYGA